MFCITQKLNYALTAWLNHLELGKKMPQEVIRGPQEISMSDLWVLWSFQIGHYKPKIRKEHVMG